MSVVVTGAAGFIGYHVCERLLAKGRQVIGIDNLNAYYDVTLKQRRLERLLRGGGNFSFTATALEQTEQIRKLLVGAETVIHLAAQAGVRHSITHPHDYVGANLAGFVNVLEGCRHGGAKHLVYASSSSVYGANRKRPFAETDPVDHPVSLYAATKRANELIAHSYSHLYGLPTTGLRFFTVYGPWGRPDMAMFLFARAILADEPIRLFNEGRMRRAFSYIDDIVDGVLAAAAHIPNGNSQSVFETPAESRAPFAIYNLGSDETVGLLRVVEILETTLGRTARRELLPMQPGDVAETTADLSHSRSELGYNPRVAVETGIARFVQWYLEYYGTQPPLSN